MSITIASSDVARFSAAIERTLGLSFEDDKRDFLTELLRARLEKNRETAENYLTRLESQTTHTEWSALSQLVTVPETYFFRHSEQFQAFAEVALPNRMRAQSALNRLSILSAGCASGEEAYSIAVLTREATRNLSWNISILGVDINPANIKKAVDGRYSPRALRQTTVEMQQKLFGQQLHDYVLDETIRKAVRFEELNLCKDDPNFWRPESYDIIFCRNVIMYFSAEQAQMLISRFVRALVPGGYLFLGYAENLRGLSQAFHVCHTHETFYYRLRTRDEAVSEQEVQKAAPIRMPPPPPEVSNGNVFWFQAIRPSAEHTQALDETPTPASATGAAKHEPQWNLGQAFDLMGRERFDEALNAVRNLPADAADDPDAVLLQAVLCVHTGRLSEAELLCRHLLDMDELNAGAHYVLAMCCEGTGNDQAAVRHDQTAAYLDPSFAMPRLHLGLLARRANDQESARLELQQALFLLQREELSRLIMFGGGFGREALLALCRAELKMCGGRP